MKIFRYFFVYPFLLLIVSTSYSQTAVDSLKQKLIDGNTRFVTSQMTHPHSNDLRRTEVAQGQHPFAVIVTCSDSRVPPEIIFDQGLGDLFVIRTAGEVVDSVAIASIEYAADHLGVKLVVVMGHSKCGAVEAAVKGGHPEGHLKSIVDKIIPAVKTAKKEAGDLVDNSVKENVFNIVKELNASKPVLKNLVDENKLDIIGAYYNITDGVVSF